LIASLHKVSLKISKRAGKRERERERKRVTEWMCEWEERERGSLINYLKGLLKADLGQSW